MKDPKSVKENEHIQGNKYSSINNLPLPPPPFSLRACCPPPPAESSSCPKKSLGALDLFVSLMYQVQYMWRILARFVVTIVNALCESSMLILPSSGTTILCADRGLPALLPFHKRDGDYATARARKSTTTKHVHTSNLTLARSWRPHSSERLIRRLVAHETKQHKY